MTPKVYDKSGVERDLDWLKRTYGAEYVPVSDPSKPHFKLLSVQGRTGPAEITIWVRTQEGIGWGGCMVACSWPDASVDLTTPDAQAFKTIYAPRADVKLSEADGKAGFGTGRGDFMPVVGSGVRAGWILHNLYPSEVLCKIGQLGGTDHEGPNVLAFQLVNGGGTPPPDDDGGESTHDYTLVLGRIADTLERLATHFGA